MQSVDKCSPIRLAAAYSPRRLAYHLVRWREPRDRRLEWITESDDRRTDRDGQNRFTSESAFISAAEELLRNIRKRFVSTTLPDGRVLDEAAMRALVANTSANC